MLFDKGDYFTGTQVNYCVICPRKLWYFSHYIRMEQNSDLVAMGKLIHETSYKRATKEVVIDQKIGIDFIKKGEKLVLHEVKKSKKMEDAHMIQLLYYLFVLKNRGVDAVGEIDYPTIREKKEVILTVEAEEMIRGILVKIKEVIALEKPPKAEKRGRCRKCSYFELCYVK